VVDIETLGFQVEPPPYSGVKSGARLSTPADYLLADI
jgi:hypothetical protein